MLLPEFYALPQSASKLLKVHVPTTGMARALFVYLLPLSGTDFLTAFVYVKQLSNRHSLAPPSDPPAQRYIDLSFI